MYPKSWQRQTGEAVVLLLVVAFAARLIWGWLAVVTPVLIALVVLGVVYRLVLGRWRR